MNTMQTLPENWQVGNASQLIFWGQNYPDTQIWQRNHKKRKLQINIHVETSCDIFNQIFSKSNPTTYEKGNTPWPSWAYLSNPR